MIDTLQRLNDHSARIYRLEAREEATGAGTSRAGWDRTISYGVTLTADACVVTDIYTTIEADGVLTLEAGAELMIIGDANSTSWAVTITADNYTPPYGDRVIVQTVTEKTISLPPSIGSYTTYRIRYRPASGSLTIDGYGADTIMGDSTQTLYAGEDLIVTDTATGVWE